MGYYVVSRNLGSLPRLGVEPSPVRHWVPGRQLRSALFGQTEACSRGIAPLGGKHYIRAAELRLKGPNSSRSRRTASGEDLPRAGGAMLHTYVVVFIGSFVFIPGGSNPDVTSPNAVDVGG